MTTSISFGEGSNVATERVKELMREAATKRATAKTFAEWAKWDAIYTALKTQWNKRTGNALLEVTL